MDVTVALYFYHLGVSHGVYHYWYFGLTITFILVKIIFYVFSAGCDS